MSSSSADAAHEFGALNTLLLVVILGLCILAAYLIKQNSFYYLPESAAAILVGVIVGCLARAVYPSTEELDFLTFEPEVFFFLLLPPIIFEAGYSLKKRDFFSNFWTINLFAVIGTLISTFIIGFLVYCTGLMGLAKIDTSSPMEALIFGSVISAVDPVATLSIMGNPELNCDPLLYSLVFGESVLNDAVAIVLFKTFMSSYDSNEAFSSTTILSVMGSFTGICLGSLVIGVIIGLICSYLGKNTQMRKYPEYELAMLFLFAYGSYSFSEALQMSGIMSLFFCGIVLSHYNSYNLSQTTQITSHYAFKSIAILCEFFVFLFIGMGIFTGRFKQFNLLFFILVALFCLFSRMFNTFPLSYAANLGRVRAIPVKMQMVIWFAGLRGAISFALSMQMPGEHRDLYISATLFTVVFTTVVCGGLTEPMLSRMGMRIMSGVSTSNHHQTDQYELCAAGNEEGMMSPGINRSTSVSSTSGKMAQAKSFFHQFDRSFMTPMFGGPQGNEATEDTDLHPTASVDVDGTMSGTLVDAMPADRVEPHRRQSKLSVSSSTSHSIGH